MIEDKKNKTREFYNIEESESYFRELKFYTNNDFSFIDVHNEELFKENSEILLKNLI